MVSYINSHLRQNVIWQFLLWIIRNDTVVPSELKLLVSFVSVAAGTNKN